MSRGDDIHLEAHASGEATINQAGRDQHVHYTDGTRARRRAVSAAHGQECPYPGLAAFGPDQAHWFFGRDETVADLLARLDDRSRRGGLQLMVAPSGAGKSSLLRAGLLPRLAGGALPGSAAWPLLVLTPTADPLGALAARLCSRSGERPEEVAAILATTPQHAVTLLSGREAVVVVDQLEEVFTLCPDETRRGAFIRALACLAAPGAEGPAALVVAGLRADFYAACAAYAPLRAALQDRHLLLGAMTPHQLREAILYPADQAGLDIEPGLVELLLRDLGVTPGVDAYEVGRLPLLAHALRTTWQQRHGATLTVRGYHDTGTIHSAIANTAEHAYTALAPAARQAVRPMFLRLIKIGDRAEDARRRLSRAELAGVDSAALDAFTEARLLTQAAGTVEITHEALLRGWPRLRGWLDDDRAGTLLHQDLEDTAAAWHRAGRDPSLLYRGGRLEAARAWADTGGTGDMSPTARDFLSASIGIRRRAQRLRAVVVAVSALLTVAAITAAVFAFAQRGEALHQRDTARYQRILSESDRTAGTDTALAAQLALLAHRERPAGQSPDETYTRLLSTQNTPLPVSLKGHTDDVNQVAFSPDGTTLASASSDGQVRLWNVTDPDRPGPRGRAGHTGGLFAVAYSPDGETLAGAGRDGRVRLWDVTDPDRPTPRGRPLMAHDGDVNAVAYSQDGRTLASAGQDGHVRLWDVTDPDRPTSRGRPIAGLVTALAFSGKTLAGAGSDGRVRLWNVADPGHPTPYAHDPIDHVGTVYTVAFSPDGKTLASGGDDRSIRLWDVTDPAHARPRAYPLMGHTSSVRAVAFSPDGKTLAGSGDDQSVRLWDLAALHWPVPRGPRLTGHHDNVWGLAFSPDGTTLASASDDRSILLWRIPAAQQSAHNGGVTSVAYSPDGKVLASGGDRSVRLWDVSGRLTPRGPPLTGHTGLVYAVAFSPKGRILASGGDRSVRLWDVSGRPGRPLTGHAGSVRAVAFSPDGRTLASGGEDPRLRLWDVTDPAHARLRGRPLTGHPGFLYAMAFSPDGNTLASAGANQEVRLWDVTDPDHPVPRGRPLTGHTGTIRAVRFSPDGKTLASAGEDRQLRTWDVTDPDHPAPRGRPVTGHPGAVYALEFSPDGKTLISSGADGALRLWDTTGRPSPRGRPLTGHTDNVLSVRFSPDGRTLASGSTDRGLWLWNLDVAPAIQRVCILTTFTPQAWREHVGTDIPYAPPCGS